MKNIYIVAVCAFVLAGNAFAANREKLEKALIENENKIVDAIMKNDVATFQKMIAPGAMSAEGNGIMPAAEFAKVIPSIKVTDSKVSDARVHWVDNNTAIVMYKWTGKGTIMGQPVPSPTYASTVWTKKGKSWLGVFHQETPAASHPAGK
jgi:hypothetical protein